MLNTTERMQKLLAANTKTLARIDQILSGEDSTSGTPEADVSTCTQTEAARRLRMSRPTISRLIQAGRLETVALNGVRRVRMTSVLELVEGKRDVDRAANEKVVAMGRARFERGIRTKNEKRAAQ